MNRNQNALLELIKTALFGAQTVTSLVAALVPSGVAEKWKIATARSEASFLRVLHGQSQLVQLLEDTGIPLVILKGTAATMYYPALCCRMMGDVDALVPQERFEQAARLMEALKSAFAVRRIILQNPELELDKEWAKCNAI